LPPLAAIGPHPSSSSSGGFSVLFSSWSWTWSSEVIWRRSSRSQSASTWSNWSASHPVAGAAAVDLVDLAVTHQEAVIALAAGEVVAVRIADDGHVDGGERPEHVAAVNRRG